MPRASGAVRVTPSTAAQAGLATPQKSLLDQVDGTIRYLVKNQDQSAELQLHPESLGRVQISLKVEGTVVHAKVWASEASAIPVMQDHRSFLESSLKAQGMSLGSFDLQQGRKQDQTPLPTSSEATPVLTRNLEPAGTGQESPIPVSMPSTASRIEYVA
jgi:flagellar hook-length control protein FliK